MNRSFVSLVDNARELQASLLPEEADRWRCVWDKDNCISWDTFNYTMLTGETVLEPCMPAIGGADHYNSWPLERQLPGQPPWHRLCMLLPLFLAGDYHN